MELNQAIKSRRSIRNFQDKPIDQETVDQLIEAANWAPSACNVQGWKFIIVDSSELKNKIVDNGGSRAIGRAPLGVLVLYNNQSHNSTYQDYIQSSAAAIQNLLLKAVELNLGACWTCHLPAKYILRKIFNIPKKYSPIAYIPLGYPAEQPVEVPRKYKLEEIMNYNEFNKDWPNKKVNSLILFTKKILIKIYYSSPLFIKKIFLNKLLDKNFVKKFEN